MGHEEGLAEDIGAGESCLRLTRNLPFVFVFVPAPALTYSNLSAEIMAGDGYSAFLGGGQLVSFCLSLF